MSEEEKNKIKEYQKKRYQELIQYKKEALKNKVNKYKVKKIHTPRFINIELEIDRGSDSDSE